MQNTDQIANAVPGLGASFSTPGVTTFLSSVSLELLLPGASTGGSVRVALHADNQTQIGAKLTDLGIILESSLHVGNQVVTIPVPFFFLSTNTRYWIVLSTNDNSILGWSWTNSATGVGVLTEFAQSNTVISNANSVTVDMMRLTAEELLLAE